MTITPDATMEHILPQRPAPGSRWTEDYAPGTEVNSLKHVLGNLTLLTEPEQNRAANREFEAKRSIYAGSAFVLSQRLATEVAWRPDDIRARTARLADDFMAALGLA